jgi:hypothetical protein
MAKYPKFLVANNPMVNPDDVYIFHSQRPRLLVKVENEAFMIVDDIDNATEGDANKLEGLISRMNDWYKSYKIHKNKR